MSDRCLYRGKSIQLNTFLYGYYFYSEREDKHYIIGESKDYGWQKHEVDTATIGQCTGLRDKNGKLIFEGDIVDYTRDSTSTTYDCPMLKLDRGIVSWEKYGWRIKNKKLHVIGAYVITTGNIHDNPELIGGAA